MSVAGFDVGNQASCVAVARKRGIDVLMNKESKRETPSVIAFGPKNRSLGTDAVGSMSINPRNTVSQLKRLLGKPFKSLDVQKDLQALPYEAIEGPDGGILIQVDYLGERQGFSPEQLFAMLMVDMKAVAEADGSPVTDCVVAVPTYFTEAERYALLNASQVAGVNCLRLFNETTATALAYGIYKTDLPEKDAINVVFVDVGNTALQVSIVAFKKGQLRVLSHAWDRNLGGRDFDEVLFNHFCAEFGAKHKIDIKSNARASFRLRQACEKAKKVMSANAQAPLSVECIMNDVDVRGMISRDEFEAMAQPILQRALPTLQQAVADAGLEPSAIHSVEAVGSSSRVPALLNILQEFFGKEPGRTLNSKEVVSRGCALNCAMLSPIFRVRDFEVVDAHPFGVLLKWEKDGSATSQVLFKRMGPTPSLKALTLMRSSTFTMEAAYTEDSVVPADAGSSIASFTIGPPVARGAPGSSEARLKVHFRLNLHGIVTVESVNQLEEEEYEEEVKIEKPKPGAAAAAAPAGADAKMEDVAPGEAAVDAQQEAEDAAAAGAQVGETGPSPMETEAKGGDGAAAAANGDAAPVVEKVKRKRTRKHAVPVQSQAPGLNTQQLQGLFEKECQMALQDKIQEETNEVKNSLEAYIYSLRGKLADAYAEYSTEQERSTASAQLEKMEDWLYEDGEDEVKSVYTAKLNDLKTLGGPVEMRYREAAQRPAAIASLQAVASNFVTFAQTTDPAYNHIAQKDRQSVVAECQKAMSWLQEKEAAQSSLRKTDEPVLVCADIKKKEETLTRFANPIVTKPPPPPPKKEEKAEEKSAPAAAAAAGPAASEPMETDVPPAQASAGPDGATANASAGHDDPMQS